MSTNAAEQFAPPGSVLEIRDETWLVTRTERATDGWFVEVQGLSELVRGAQATFSTAIDTITPLDPEKATVKVDSSAGYKPAAYLLKGVPEGDREDLLRRERALFYVAATRARDELVVLWSGAGSEFVTSSG